MVTENQPLLTGAFVQKSRQVPAGRYTLLVSLSAVSGATISFKMLIDVGDGVLSDRTPEAAAPVPEPLEITLDNLMDW